LNLQIISRAQVFNTPVQTDGANVKLTEDTNITGFNFDLSTQRIILSLLLSISTALIRLTLIIYKIKKNGRSH
jgi:hypothetical protein